MLFSHGHNKAFLVPDSCGATVRNGNSISAVFTEDTIENDIKFFNTLHACLITTVSNYFNLLKSGHIFFVFNCLRFALFSMKLPCRRSSVRLITVLLLASLQRNENDQCLKFVHSIIHFPCITYRTLSHCYALLIHFFYPGRGGGAF